MVSVEAPSGYLEHLGERMELLHGSIADHVAPDMTAVFPPAQIHEHRHCRSVRQQADVLDCLPCRPCRHVQPK